MKEIVARILRRLLLELFIQLGHTLVPLQRTGVYLTPSFLQYTVTSLVWYVGEKPKYF